MLVEVDKFTFPADFVILKIEKDNKVPLILGRPFLYTTDAVIQVKEKQLNLRVGTERMIFNIDSAMKHSYLNVDTCFSIDVIDEILEEDFDTLLEEGSKILHSIEGTLLEEEIFVKFDEFMAMTIDENSKSESNIEEPPFKKITINTDYKIKTSLEEPPTNRKLKPLPDNLEYKRGITVFTNENDKLVPTRTVMGWLCTAPTTFQRCMLAIFHDMIEESVKVFMKDFFVFGDSFDKCRNNLDKVLQRCKDAHLVLNWEKCHFMVKEGIVLGHKVFGTRLKVDKGKINVIFKLPPPTNIEGDDSEVDDNFPGETLMEINTRNKPSRWLGPYVVKHQYLSGYVELYGKDGKTLLLMAIDSNYIMKKQIIKTEGEIKYGMKIPDVMLNDVIKKSLAYMRGNVVGEPAGATKKKFVIKTKKKVTTDENVEKVTYVDDEEQLRVATLLSVGTKRQRIEREKQDKLILEKQVDKEVDDTHDALKRQ
nr:retrovirus-related Pol polyprotein from transposon 17.6 [Tanacetum cinerariifolium]